MYVVTSIKNTSRPVGYKTIPHLRIDKFGANNKLLQDSSTHIPSEAARVSLVKEKKRALTLKVLNHYTLHDSSKRWTLLPGIQSD